MANEQSMADGENVMSSDIFGGEWRNGGENGIKNKRIKKKFKMKDKNNKIKFKKNLKIQRKVGKI